MAQTERIHGRTSSTEKRTSWSWKRLFGSSKDESHTAIPSSLPLEPQQQQLPVGLAKRLSKKVIPGLPRAGTFRRQQSELRDRLEPTKPNVDERRTVSVDRRIRGSIRNSSAGIVASARLSAPEISESTQANDAVIGESSLSRESTREGVSKEEYIEVGKEPSLVDTRSISSTNNDEDDKKIQEELESKWILNLSMHFRDKSKREKFFVTYAETPTYWRRVTISLDYRDTPEGSLEEELESKQFQRDKSARIYEAIRESLPDIQFYSTVTNLKLQTENDRLHVHVVEDLSEIISYPPVKNITHLNCRRFREDELVFESHLSGFVYKVRMDGQVFIKKEIPGPDTVDEFLYEINALHQLSGSKSVIQFGGVVLDNKGELVKGLLISFAEKGALIDTLYDGEGRLSWPRRERWARQIVQGLSEIHDAGFVQGDFTLSNIVIDKDDNAKIIDINRRGCPVGWEPPEVAALLDGSQRISMYIGVKSDLYQLGMVLYALATQQDEPENHRPLNLEAISLEVPDYFLDMCRRCLSVDPRGRSQASTLLSLFPPVSEQENDTASSVSNPTIVDAFHVDDLPFSNEPRWPLRNVGGYTNLPYLEKPIDVYEYAVTDTSEDSDYYPRRGRSPAVPNRRGDSLPFETPLPRSGSGSDDTDSPLTSAADELTPLASNLDLGKKGIIYLNGSIYENSQEGNINAMKQRPHDIFTEGVVASPNISDHTVAPENHVPMSLSVVSQESLLGPEEGSVANHHGSSSLGDDMPDLMEYIPRCAAHEICLGFAQEIPRDEEPTACSENNSSDEPSTSLESNHKAEPQVRSNVEPDNTSSKSEPEIISEIVCKEEPEINSEIKLNNEPDILPEASPKDEHSENVPTNMCSETTGQNVLTFDPPQLEYDSKPEVITIPEPGIEQVELPLVVLGQTMESMAQEDEVASETISKDEHEFASSEDTSMVETKNLNATAQAEQEANSGIAIEIAEHTPAISQDISKGMSQNKQDHPQKMVSTDEPDEQAQEEIKLEEVQDQTPQQHLEPQPISKKPETSAIPETPKIPLLPETAGTRRTSSEHPDLAYIGTHIELSNTS